MIERKAKVTVNEWITHGNDAFLLTGARQIGKTYLIRQCLKESGYPYIIFNFSNLIIPIFSFFPTLFCSLLSIKGNQ